MSGQPQQRRRLALVGLAFVSALAGACLTLDPFLYTPETVENYDWDADPCDPQLSGELAPYLDEPACHPSLIPEADRREGLIARDDRDVHFVFAHHGEPRATIFYSHGRSRHIGRYWDRVELMWEAGYNVMIYDYPTYGRSTGETLDETTIYENAESALEQTMGFAEVDVDRVFFYGYSLGGGPTYELALRGIRDEGPMPAGLISESAFCSVEALIQDGSGLNWPGAFLADDVYDNCGKMEAITRDAPTLPIMVLHGDDDDFILPTHAELLRQSAQVEIEYRRLAGGVHSNLPAVEGTETYLGWLQDFTGQP